MVRKWMVRNCLFVIKRSLSRKVFLIWWAEASCTPTVARPMRGTPDTNRRVFTYPSFKNVCFELALQAALYPRFETVKNASCEHSAYVCIPGSYPAQNRAETQFWTTRQRDNCMWWGGGGSFCLFFWWVFCVAAGRLELGYDPVSFLLSAWAKRQAKIPFKKAAGVLCGALLLSVWVGSDRHTQVTRACLSTSALSFAVCFCWKAVVTARRGDDTNFVTGIVTAHCLSFSEGYSCSVGFFCSVSQRKGCFYVVERASFLADVARFSASACLSLCCYSSADVCFFCRVFSACFSVFRCLDHVCDIWVAWFPESALPCQSGTALVWCRFAATWCGFSNHSSCCTMKIVCFTRFVFQVGSFGFVL